MALTQDYMEPLLKYQKKKCFEEKEENSNETEYSYLRLLPDMSEGLIGLCIGDIMGILYSIDSTKTLTIQQQQLLKVFIETLLKTSRSSFSIFKLSILYLYKLNKKLREPSALNKYKHHHTSKTFFLMETIKQAELLFVVILMLAFKYTEDHCYYISAWSKATGIPSEVIHQVEVDVLNILEHNLFVSQERFESFSSRIIQKINKLKMNLLQSVKISYASSNYSSSSEEESTKSDSSDIPLRCRKCCCKRKQECLENSSFYKKRKVSQDLTVEANTKDQTDNASTFYTLPTTLYDYYKNRNSHGFGNQPLTPPTPSTYTTTTTPSTISTSAPTYNNNLLQVDSLIIPSTPPTSQTSIYEDLEREEAIKKGEEEEEEEEYDEDYEDLEEEDDDEGLQENLIKKPSNHLKSSSMAFILNPDENKIQFDSGERSHLKPVQATTIPYRYHTPSPKTNFAYDNLKKVNLLAKKGEKQRTTASIVLPNTSPVGDVASVFPSLSMLSSQSQSLLHDAKPTEDTTPSLSVGLKSLLAQRSQKPTVNSIIISNSQDPAKASHLSQNQYPVKTNFINTIPNNITTTTTNTTNDIHTNPNDTNTNCPYLNHLYSLPNDDMTKQKILLSIYNCYAMRNIRHYQI